MRNSVLLFFVLSLLGQVCYAQPGRTVLDRRELENTGVLTLNDIFELTGQWTVSSIDGFTLTHSRNGLSGTGGIYWPVFLNDVPLDMNIWDTRSLNRIPVNISQIDSVVVISEPQLAGGTSMERGGVFIYTQSPEKGIGVNAGLWTGNRSGDPGPFVYTDRATPNLERLGPIASVSVSYNDDRYSVEGGMKRILNFVSDPIQSGRMLPLAFGDDPFRHPKIELESFYLRGSHSGGSYYHQIQAGLSDVDDLLNTALYGTEIPVDNRWTFLSLGGSVDLVRGTGIRYRLNHSRNEVVERENKENRLLRWDQRVTAGQVSVLNSFERGSVETGVGYVHYLLNDKIGNNETFASNLLRVFNHLRLDLTGWLTSYTDLMLVKGENDSPAVKSFFNFVARPSEQQRLSAGFSYSGRLPEEDNSLWFWIGEKGFGGDILAGYADADSGIQSPIRLLRGHLSWRISASEQLSIESKIGISRYLDDYAPTHTLVSREQRYIETGAFSLMTDLDATELTVPAKLTFKPLNDLHGTIQYTGNHRLSGPDGLWQRIPEHRFHARFNWNPVDSFNIWTKVDIRSETDWSSVTLLDGETLRTNYGMTDVTYRSVSPARIQLDAGFAKKIWDEQVAFKLQVLNLLNEKYREHPLGPMHSFTVFLGAEVRLSRQ